MCRPGFVIRFTSIRGGAGESLHMYVPLQVTYHYQLHACGDDLPMLLGRGLRRPGR